MEAPCTPVRYCKRRGTSGSASWSPVTTSTDEDYPDDVHEALVFALKTNNQLNLEPKPPINPPQDTKYNPNPMLPDFKNYQHD